MFFDKTTVFMRIGGLTNSSARNAFIGFLQLLRIQLSFSDSFLHFLQLFVGRLRFRLCTHRHD